jgi:hypothetical protein
MLTLTATPNGYTVSVDGADTGWTVQADSVIGPYVITDADGETYGDPFDYLRQAKIATAFVMGAKGIMAPDAWTMIADGLA